jgi:hypothetical protein
MYHLDNNNLICATFKVMMQKDDKNTYIAYFNTGQRNILIISNWEYKL